LEECKGVTPRRGRWLVVLALAVPVALGLAQSRAADAPPAPLTILVSFDGWRWDYDTKAPAPALRALMARGVRTEGLIPAYPSKTVPNHYSMATGLYPGHHGMIGNVIRDPDTGRVFRRTDRAEVQNPMWWGGEPIWNTAQRQGLIAATMFWPGSEAPVGGMLPRYWREFDATVPPAARVDQVLAWLDAPAADRPSLVTLYFDEVDVMGHWYGPDSRQVKDAIVRTDAQLGRLVDGLAARRLLDGRTSWWCPTTAWRRRRSVRPSSSTTTCRSTTSRLRTSIQPWASFRSRHAWTRCTARSPTPIRA
jgi:predicted AlkP superfamily pyrophosphatase or phosphodiesterase